MSIPKINKFSILFLPFHSLSIIFNYSEYFLLVTIDNRIIFKFNYTWFLEAIQNIQSVAF